jgi:hypothetical protein
MKFCKKCEYCQVKEADSYARCLYGLQYTRDLVFGNIDWVCGGDFLACSYSRSQYELCGKEGKWYKEKN